MKRHRTVTAVLWLGFGLAAGAMAYAAWWPDDLRDSGRLWNALAAAKFVLTVLPVHTAVGLVVWAALAAALRRFSVSAASLGLAAVLLAWSLPLIGPAVPAPAGPTLRVMTTNIRFDHPDAEGRLAAAVDRLRPDLLLCQEWAPLHESPLGTALSERFPHRLVRRDPTTDIDGVAAFSRFPLTEVPLDADPETALPAWLHPKLQRLRLEVAGRAVAVFNVHPSSPQSLAAITANRDTQRRLAGLAGAAAAAGPVIVAGDFNAPPRSAPVRAYAAAGLVDAHAAAGSGFGHTWPEGKLPFFVPGVRIDAVWCGGGLVPVHSEVAPDTGSDHRPVLAELRFAE